jgi:hypothetical protein
MPPKNQNEFEAALRALDQRFINEERTGETDEEVADAILDYVLTRERLRRGVADDTPEAEAVDAETIARMQAWDTDDSGMVVPEKVFRRLASASGPSAVVLLKDAITKRQSAVSEAQRQRARTKRAPRPFDALLVQIVKANPTISTEGLKRTLRAAVGKGVIFEIDEDEGEIILCGDKAKPIKTAGLKDRLTRLKKKYSQ